MSGMDSEQMRKLLAAKHILEQKGDNMSPDDVAKLKVINAEIGKMREGYEDVDDLGPSPENLSGCRDRLQTCGRKLRLAMKRLSDRDNKDGDNNRSGRTRTRPVTSRRSENDDDDVSSRRSNRSDRRGDRQENRLSRRSNRRDDEDFEVEEDFGAVQDKMQVVSEIADAIDIELNKKQRKKVAKYALNNDLTNPALRAYIRKNYGEEGFDVDHKKALYHMNNDEDDDDEDFDTQRRARATYHRNNDDDEDFDTQRRARTAYHRNNDDDEDFEGGNFLTANQMDDLSTGAFNVDSYETMVPVVVGKKKNQ
jgi:hypothetical protein